MGGLPWPLLQAFGSAKTRGGTSPQVKSLFSRDLILSTWYSHMGLGGLVCMAHVGLCDPSGPCWSSGIGGPHYGTLRNLLEPPVQYRKILNFSGNPENDFPYMNLILRTIPDLLVMSWIPSETSNKLRSPSHISNLLMRYRTLSASPYGSRTMQTWSRLLSEQ